MSNCYDKLKWIANAHNKKVVHCSYWSLTTDLVKMHIYSSSHLSHLAECHLALLWVDAVGGADGGELVAVDGPVSTGVFQLEHELAVQLLPLQGCGRILGVVIPHGDPLFDGYLDKWN